ncbi:tyrosine/dopa decarboxylase 2 [Quercus suber]|uniref:Tyrosine/dopa decarboxylase 2 n=1 Tax=Quercus suber TaxID=58331 RepID=A0AAW0KXQ6_QUESU
MGSLNSDNVASHTSSSNISPLDPEEFRRQGHMIIDFLADYYRDVEKYPVQSQVEPGYLQKRLPKSTPHNPEPIETILQDVQEHIVPGLTHWQSPNFFAYFQCTSSIAGFLGDMLSTGFNVVGFSWIASPAATELEIINLVKLVVYASDQTHSAFQKAAQIAGIHPMNFRAIKTPKSTSFALSPDSLRAQIFEDVEAGLVPLFLCATVGTTPTAAIDPLESLCAVAKDYGMWVHVDAAYAGSACICPEFRHFIDGVEGANSFSLNAHKWFLTSLDCCCLWVKDPSALIKSLSTNPEFLRNKASDSKQVVDYKDWQITLSRRFRSLKLWFVLRSYGVAKLRSFMRNHVKMANLFEGLVAMDKRFEIVVPTNFAMVCFRILPSALSEAIYKNGKLDIVSEEHANEANRKLLESINMSGCVFMTHAVVEGVYVIRFAVGATLVEERHVITAWKVVQKHANVILSNHKPRALLV